MPDEEFVCELSRWHTLGPRGDELGTMRHTDLDLAAALEDTGVAIVTEEVPSINFVRQRPRVYFKTPISLVYASVGNLLVAYATDISTGEPATGVAIALNATNSAVRIDGHIRHGRGVESLAKTQFAMTQLASCVHGGTSRYADACMASLLTGS